MINLNKCKEILGPDGVQLTEEELLHLREFLYLLANIHWANKVEKQSGRIETRRVISSSKNSI
jgi:hypothetical protein